MDRDTGKRLVKLADRIVTKFNEGHWEELGLLSGHSREIQSYPRLMRSLQWSDDDYRGNVLGVLRQIVERDANALQVIERYVDEHFTEGTEYVSAEPAERRITFAPNAFSVPDVETEPTLAAVMMPLSAEFNAVYRAIGRACDDSGLECVRADDIWEGSVIIQDIFNLIFKARVVVVDFSGKNPNVMYETGIAHTLGKHVVPISQSLDDVPFDLKHHRILRYLPNAEGLKALQKRLAARLRQVAPVAPDDSPDEEEMPF